MSALLLVIIYLAFIALGLPDSLLGTAWPVAHADLGVPISLAGIVSIVAVGGTVVSSLFSDRLIKRFGTGTVTAFSVLLTAIGLMGMGFVKSFWVVLLLAIPLGIGGGTVDAALNNFVALHYKAKHMNWLHCCWGVGATTGPIVMSYFLARNFWHGAYRMIAMALLLIAAIIAASMPLWKRAGNSTTAQKAKSAAIVPKKVLIRLPGAVFACVAFLAYCAMEIATGLWISSYFVNVRKIAPDTAAFWASLFYMGITVGRLVSGFAAIKIKNRTLVRVGLGMILVGLITLLIPLPGAAQVTSLLLIGFGCAPIFPSLLDETPKLFGVEYSQGMMGMQLAGAYIGGAFFAPLFGWISPIIGLQSLPLYLLAMFALLVFSTERTKHMAEKSGVASRPLMETGT